MIRLLEISNQTLFWYYLASNLAYLAMLIIALKTSARHQRRLESHRLNWFKEACPAAPQKHRGHSSHEFLYPSMGLRSSRQLRA